VPIWIRRERGLQNMGGATVEEIACYANSLVHRSGNTTLAVSDCLTFQLAVDPQSKPDWKKGWLEAALNDGGIERIFIFLIILDEKGPDHMVPVVIQKDPPTTVFYDMGGLDSHRYAPVAERAAREMLPDTQHHRVDFHGKFPFRDGCYIFTLFFLELFLEDDLPPFPSGEEDEEEAEEEERKYPMPSASDFGDTLDSIVQVNYERHTKQKP